MRCYPGLAAVQKATYGHVPQLAHQQAHALTFTKDKVGPTGVLPFLSETRTGETTAWKLLSTASRLSQALL